MAQSHTVEVSTLTLEALSDLIGEPFAAHIESIAEAFEEPDQYAGKKLVAELRVSVSFELNVEHRTLLVSAGANVKLPKRRSVIRAGRIAGGLILIEPDPRARQARLFTHTKTSGE